MPFLRHHLPAALTSAVLGLWFILVYGLGNYLASQREHVGTWYYAWERHIPLVPWMIVPYMSIDLFFVTSPFLCTSHAERMTLAKRIFFAITVAGVFFIAMPLTLAVERPAVDGVFGPIFKFLHGFDAPHNLLPSLHIALRSILAATFARHTAKHWKIALTIWFSLIGVSTLLVHQHHIVDVVAGFMLATLCFYFFPEPREDDALDRGVAANKKVGWLYGGGAIACLGLAFVWPWWSLWMLWPALARDRRGEFVEARAGDLPQAGWTVAAVVEAGARPAAGWAITFASALRPTISAARCIGGDRLVIGRRLSDREAATLVREHGIVAIVDLTAEFPASRPFLSLAYCNVQVADLTAPSNAQLDRAVAFINAQAGRGKVYIHCKAGYSRTAAVAGAAMLAADTTRSVDEVLSALRSTRAGIVVRPEIVAALHRYRRKLTGAG